jgi:hypothetical protein
MSSNRIRAVLAGAAFVGVLALAAQSPSPQAEPAPKPVQQEQEQVYAAALPERTRADISVSTTTTTMPPTTTTTAPPPPPTTTTAPPAPVTHRQSSGGSGDPSSDASWDRLAQCESGGNWAINTGNGYYGGLQFSLSSWQGVGGTGYPHEHSRSEQIHRGRLLWDQGGWAHWPGCTRSFGWR